MSIKVYLPGVLALALLSAEVAADPEIHSLSIFQSSDAKVELPDIIPGEHVRLYTVDAMARASDLLNKQVSARVPRNVPFADLESAYTQAFFDFQQSKDWQAVHRLIDQGVAATDIAVRMNVKKVPAIVINEHYVFYGVRHLDEALQIYYHRSLQ